MASEYCLARLFLKETIAGKHDVAFIAHRQSQILGGYWKGSGADRSRIGQRFLKISPDKRTKR
jgi:hypothetical protein